MLLPLNAIATQQEHPTSKTAEAITKLLNYAATHPDAILRYYASNMVLHIHSDASYLSAPQAQSRTNGHFFLSKRPPNTSKPGATTTLLNGAVHSVCELLCNIMALAAEAEVGVLYTNAWKGEELCTALEEMGHPQPPTPIMTGNTTTNRIVNDTVKQRTLCAIDMQFYWLKDRCQQGHFQVFTTQWNTTQTCVSVI
eukprot:15336885-Ditylum_brightwellii.AAC.1